MRRVFEEGFNQGRYAVAGECLSPVAVDRHPFAPDEPDFAEHLKGAMRMLRSALPDLHMEVEDLVAEGNRVAARVTLTGTHTGSPLFGLPPSGRQIRTEQFHIVEFDEQARGIRHWANIGEAEMRAQAGGSLQQV